jgi:hypothetical protein
MGKYYMNIEHHHFALAEDLAQNIIELSNHYPGIECHNKGGWQGNVDETYPQWAHDLVSGLTNYFNDYRMHGIWFNVNGPGHSNRMHRHYVNSTTAVLYVQVPQNSGNVLFQQGQQQLSITPYPGLLLTFPSDIMHGVGENKSELSRISVAFNLVSL